LTRLSRGSLRSFPDVDRHSASHRLAVRDGPSLDGRSSPGAQYSCEQVVGRQTSVQSTPRWLLALATLCITLGVAACSLGADNSAARARHDSSQDQRTTAPVFDTTTGGFSIAKLPDGFASSRELHHVEGPEPGASYDAQEFINESAGELLTVSVHRGLPADAALHSNSAITPVASKRKVHGSETFLATSELTQQREVAWIVGDSTVAYVIGNNMSDDELLAIARRVTVQDAKTTPSTISGLLPAAPGISARLEIPGPHRMTAGSTKDGTLILTNRTGTAIDLAALTPNHCTPKFEIVLTNAAHPPSAQFTLECGAAPFIVVPGSNAFPFKVASSFSRCSTNAVVTPDLPPCLNDPTLGVMVPPLPPGRYRAVLVGDELAIPPPKPVAIKVVR
jgi:hypothetical protein